MATNKQVYNFEKNTFLIDTTVDLSVVISAGVSVALVTLNVDGATYEYSGSAKLSPGDKFDREIATKMAIGRAFERAGTKLLKQANGKVDCNEHNRNHSRVCRQVKELHDSLEASV